MRYQPASSLAATLCLVLACGSDEPSETSDQRAQPTEEGSAGAANGGAPSLSDPSASAPGATDGADDAPASGSSSDGASPAGADAGSPGGAFFVQQVVDSDAGPVSYLAAVPGEGLDALAGVDATALGVSFTGDNPAAAFGTSVFVASIDEPAIARFDLGADGLLVAGPSLSFGELGVLDIFYWRIIVASDTKAYLFDSENGRAIAWNPTTMQVTGAEIDISESVKPGFTLDPLAYFGRVSGGTLFVPASWYSDEDGASLGTAAVYAIDVATDELLEYGEDARCPGYMLATLPTGDVHVLPDNLFAEELGLGTEQSACSLRIAAGSTGFDPDYAQDLGALLSASGAAVGFVQGGISDGSGGLYLGLAQVPGADAGVSDDDLVYDLWRWDVAGATASAVADSSITGPLFESWNGSPPSFLLQPAADLASTRALGMTGSSPAEVSIPGNIVSLARLR